MCTSTTASTATIAMARPLRTAVSLHECCSQASALRARTRSGALAASSVRFATTSAGQSTPPRPDQTPAAYCADLVKRLDPDAWLCSQFWPAGVRDLWLAWRAFNLELHLVSTTVSQPTIALMRYQFWRDTLKAVWEDKPPKHPVAIQLAEAKRVRPIQRYYLKQMIDARADNVSVAARPTLQAHLDAHAPLQNALLLGPLPLLVPPTHPQTSDISHTLTHLSSLLTTVSLLRSLPINVSKRQLNIPRDVSARHGVVDEQVFREGGEAKGVKDAAFEIGTRGMDELITARSHLKETKGKVVPEAAMPIFLAAVPAERYLKRLEALDFNPFHPDLQKADWKLAPSIWWTAWTGKL